MKYTKDFLFSVESLMKANPDSKRKLAMQIACISAEM